MKSKAFGWQHVCSFTFVQLIKTPALIVSTIMLVATAVIMMVVTSSSAFEEEEVATSTSINTLMVADETGLGASEWLDIRSMEYKGVFPENIEFVDKTADELKEFVQGENADKTAAIVLSYEADNMIFRITGYYGSKKGVDESDLSSLTDLIAANLTDRLVFALDVSEEQLEYLQTETSSEVKFYNIDENGEGSISDEESKEPGINLAEYGFGLIIMVVILLMVALSGEQVATSVAQEKASKVVEYLMTSVKPLALLIGKIVAVFAITFIEIIFMIAGYIGAAVVMVAMHPGTAVKATDLMSSMMSHNQYGMEMNVSYNLATLPIIFVIVLCGILFYVVIAALAGACVSKMEELVEGMRLFTFTMLIGSYGAMAVIMVDMMTQAPAPLKLIAEMLPLSSPFIAPSYLLAGKMTMVEGIISALILVIGLIGIIWFASRVYESLMYYNGSTIKLKQLLMLGRSRKEADHE
ncbi:MAG: ABC transporter permease [Lachnospiraceae bacterium]|nr:ABC transporter permease [Lachnospiraceae bacterium]